jgi:hypothetical protein
MKRLPFLFLFFLIVTTPVYAQTPVCPAPVLLDLSRAASACYGLESEEACVGGGGVRAIGRDGAALPAFTLTGERVAANDLSSITTRATGDEIAIVSLSARASLTTVEAREVTLLLFGDATLTNEVAPLIERVAYATGTAIIRAQPEDHADILARAGVNQSLVATGRTQDNRWLRVQVRDNDASGWVTTDVVTIDDLDALPVVTPEMPVFRPFRVMTLTTGQAALCDGALPSGLLLQTPSADTSVNVMINGIELRLAGTAFLQAADALTMYMLDGTSVVNETFVPAGAMATVSADGVTVAGYSAGLYPGLPLTSLPAFVQIAVPLTDAEIAARTEAYNAAQATIISTPEPAAQTVDTTCRRFVRRDTSMYAGPGDFYEVINELQAGAAIDPIFQTTDPQGAVWYQLRNSNWIAADQVIEEGECQPIPPTANIAAPLTNTLSLETCETTNGPLRARQQVTIQFTPPPWNNYGEARDASIIDPGRIIINARRYRPHATEPVLIAGTIGEDDERWLRRFYIVWQAVPGTHRIEGFRLHYNPICNITVPVS